MASINQSLVNELNHLISIANDGKYGYENASADTEDATLKQMFHQYSLERAGYAEVLKREVTKAGGTPETGGGPLGALHRTWMDIKSAISSGNREAVLNACITGEEAAVKAYSDAVNKDNVPTTAKQVITEQLSGIKFALNSIRSLAETAKT